MTDDIDKMTLQELLDYRPPTWWQQMERRFFDHPHDPPKEFRFCGHHYMLAPPEPNRWTHMTDEDRTAEAKAWMIGHPIPITNRWAAFTNDELMQISGRTYDARWWLELSEEALAELKRREHLNPT